jgi:hypothetical protein
MMMSVSAMERERGWRKPPAQKKLVPTPAGNELAKRVKALLPPGFYELSQAEKAKKMGPWISQQGVSILLAGKAVRPRYLPELARWLSEQNQRQITVEDLVPSKFARKKRPAYLAEVPPLVTNGAVHPADPVDSEKVPVKYVAYGRFVEITGDQAATEFVGRYVSRPEYTGANQYGVLLESSCVNRKFSEGSVVWCIPTAEVIGGLDSGQYVHAVRTAEDGMLEEHSIRVLKRRPGRIELHPYSFDETLHPYVFDSATYLQIDVKGRPFRLEIKGVVVAGICQARL